MNQGVAQAYKICQQFSRVALTMTILLFLIFKVLGFDLNLSSQIFIALLALAIGIPHGAIDHLVAIPAHPRVRFFTYIFLYVALTIFSIILIAKWEKLGFQIVVFMSALHFGFGDASFKSESRKLAGQKHYPVFLEFCYAIPAGFLPVILPLTNSKTFSALERINTHLVDWAGGSATGLRIFTLIFTVFSLTFFIITKHFDLVIDLLLLFLLSLIAPPLITFAIYFGGWHAARHTARLVPRLNKSKALAEEGNAKLAIWRAVVPGFYALVGSLLVAVLMMAFWSSHFSYSFLWAILVLVWALTVPHMLTTARFDLEALKSTK